MVTITSKLDIIKVISNREKFLMRLFPNGLQDIRLGRIDMLFDDKVELYIYTNQEPHFSPPKWGKYGIQFSTIVLHLSCHFIKRLNIKNWHKNKNEPVMLAIDTCGEQINLCFAGNEWMVDLCTEHIIYQDSSTYLE